MSNIIEEKTEDDAILYRINKSTGAGHYIVSEKSNQRVYYDQIKLEGFTKLPSGFYRNSGFGLSGIGNYLMSQIYTKFNKQIDLTITNNAKSKITISGKKIYLKLGHNHLSALNADFRMIKKEKNAEIRTKLFSFLAKNFIQFSDYKEYKQDYLPGTLSKILSAPSVIPKLNNEDKAKIEQFIPEYLSKVKVSLSNGNKLKIVFDSIDAGKKVYFQKIIQEFRKKLKQNVQKEIIWQEFLSKYILVLRSNYGEILEKNSVTALQGKYPDFMLIDPYSYLDIYEIKKPSTMLLQYDTSRNNYYWDKEIVKAISQVENYLHQIQRNSDSFVVDIRKSKGIDISIVRPRGYIIAGMRQQLKNTKMKDDFRILNESLKNIDVLFYE